MVRGTVDLSGWLGGGRYEILIHMPGDVNDEFRERDDALWRAARDAADGDLRPFEQLVQLYRKRILADCRYLTGDENNSEDLAQEVFVKAYFGLNRFEGRSTFRHWLQRIKVNHCLNHLKHAKEAGLSLDDQEMDGVEQTHVPPIAETNIEATEERRQVEDILNSMTPTLRIPLVMRDMDELSYEEIAATLGVGLSALKMRIKRAREHFRRRYREREENVRIPAR